jgi:HSP20 family protein
VIAVGERSEKMNMIRWEPTRRGLPPFRSFRTEVDRVFDDFFQGWSPPWQSHEAGETDRRFMPSVNLKETDGEFIVTAEVPGIPKEGLDVTMTEDSVTLKGERREEKETQEEGYLYRETAHGSFQRVIQLPGAISSEKAKAALKDGVLTLTLPKSESSKPKEIKVEVH